MKNILFINTANSGGGAEKVAFNLCKELHLRGYSSRMLARRIDYSADSLASEIVIPVPGGDMLYSAGNFLDDIFSTQYLFYLPTWKIPLMERTMKADVIHFHNLHGYYFNLLTTPILLWQKPVVWTLHDMWSFTGKCAHAFECDRYMQSCGRCPQLSSYPKLPRDTSRFHLLLKKFLYGRRRFQIISPSEWLRSHIEKSFLKEHPVTVIPSPIDTKVFYPEDKKAARQRLDIPSDKKVLLFVASWINSIPTKGINIFKEVLDTLMKRRDDIYVLIVGHLEGQSVLGNRYIGKETGYVTDPAMMRTIYCAADIFVSPTLAENSSCTIAEAMGCATVPVAFSVGGVPEQIVHNKTGMLVPREDQKQLLEAICFLLDHDRERLSLAQASAERARLVFSMDRFVELSLSVYRNAIGMKR